MNTEALLYLAGTGWLGSRLIVSLIEIIASNTNDLNQVKQKLIRKRPDARSLRKRPLISVVVYAHNAESTIEQSIKSILGGGYKKLEIIVVNIASSDMTPKIVKKLIKSNPKKTIKLINKRQKLEDEKIALAPRTLQGEIIMELDAGHMCDKSLFKNVLNHFMTNNTDVVIPAVRIQPDKSLLGLLQEYDSLRSSSAYIISTNLVTHRRPVLFRSKPHRKKTRAYHADDIVVFAWPQTSYAKLLRQIYNVQWQNFSAPEAQKQLGTVRNFIRSLGAIVLFLEPFMIAYFLYLALRFDRSEPLVIAWTLGVFSLVLYVWSDHFAPLKQKLRLTFLAPIMFVPMYVLSLTRIGVVVRYIFLKIQEDWQKWQPPLLAPV